VGLFSRKKLVQKDVSFTNMKAPNFYPLGVFNSSNSTKTLNTNTVEGQRNAYAYCPAVTAVVNMKVAMAMNGRYYFSDNKGGELKTTTRQTIDAQGTQFKTFYKTMVQVFGRSYIYVRRLPGIKEPEYHVIPNWELTENKATSDFWGSNVKSYTWSHNGMSITIQPDEIFIINDTGFDFINSSKNGGSRLVSLGDAVQNIVAAYEARNMLLTNGGPPVIVSPEKSAVGADIMMPGDKAELEQKLVDRYGFQRGKKLLAIATMPLRALKVGVTAGDLAAFEEVNNDWKEICTGYGLSPYLFGISDTTFTNFSEAQKSAYQNTIIPEQSNENEQITRYFGLNNPLMSDYSHVECLQKSLNDEITTFNSLVSAVKIGIDAGIYTIEEGKKIISENSNIVTDGKN
jgi:hypothetical protein